MIHIEPKLLNLIKNALVQASALENAKNNLTQVQTENLVLDVVLGARNLVFRTKGQAIDSIDITDFQDRTPVTKGDVEIGSTTIAARLGRDKDMAVVAAFQKVGDSICSKYLYLALRNGDDIKLRRMPDQKNMELYSVHYGSNIGIAAVRRNDFEFLWDPSTTETVSDWHLGPPINPAVILNGKCNKYAGT